MLDSNSTQKSLRRSHKIKELVPQQFYQIGHFRFYTSEFEFRFRSLSRKELKRFHIDPVTYYRWKKRDFQTRLLIKVSSVTFLTQIPQIILIQEESLIHISEEDTQKLRDFFRLIPESISFDIVLSLIFYRSEIETVSIYQLRRLIRKTFDSGK